MAVLSQCRAVQDCFSICLLKDFSLLLGSKAKQQPRVNGLGVTQGEVSLHFSLHLSHEADTLRLGVLATDSELGLGVTKSRALKILTQKRVLFLSFY